MTHATAGYGELLDETMLLLDSVQGEFSKRNFSSNISVYKQIGEMYAEHLGLDKIAAAKIAFLVSQAVLSR